MKRQYTMSVFIMQVDIFLNKINLTKLVKFSVYTYIYISIPYKLWLMFLFKIFGFMIFYYASEELCIFLNWELRYREVD